MSESGSNEESAPLDGLAREFRARRERSSDADESLFERVEAGERDGARELHASESGPTDRSLGDLVAEASREDGEIADERAWTALASGGGDGSNDPGAERTDREPSGGRVGDLRPERVVPKREYCQRCRHFAAPPRATCAREGTEIVEVVDLDRFRVRGCPMVDGDVGDVGDVADDGGGDGDGDIGGDGGPKGG
ncbi:hypothetical protein [Halegenticoccus soli]|uniref:hypothetical protein n=1 Tax=Halegenticoccus soli TaxID=1985678 RepID=UPI00117A5CDF|nr:hypothetical protein [Halegenticoccus soli]